MPKNQTSFQPGQSGNPNGAPKKSWTWAGLLEKVAEETEIKSGQKFKDLVSKRMWVDAVNGSLGAQKEIMNRMEGFPAQSTLLGNIDKDEPFIIEIIESKPLPDEQ